MKIIGLLEFSFDSSRAWVFTTDKGRWGFGQLSIGRERWAIVESDSPSADHLLIPLL